MKLGVVFPQTEIGDDVEVIRDFAVGAEEAGFDFLAAYDHVIGHRPADVERWHEMGPYTDADAFHEIFVLFSYLAAITQRLEFVTEVLVLPQRQTVLVAKQAAELQLLSGGRLRMGIGVGWNPEEYRALGMSFNDRGKRVVEQVTLLRRLWNEELVSHESVYHTLHNMGLKPRPRTPPIPIWIGGSASVALKRAATIGDGFVFDHAVADAPKVLTELRRYLTEAQRDVSSFGLAARIQLTPAIDDALAEAAQWRSLGITHLSVNTMKSGISDPREKLDLTIRFLAAWRNAKDS